MNHIRSWIVLLALLASGCSSRYAAAALPAVDAVATQSAILARVRQTQTAHPPTSTPLPTSTPTVTPAPTETAPPSVTPSPTATVTPKATVCVYNASFVRDETIPDGTRVQPEEEFTKVWLIRNSGTCAWTQDFSISNLTDPGASSSVLVEVIPVGAIAEISVRMQAPWESGVYRATWRMRDSAGTLFGDAFFVEFVVEAPPTEPPPAPEPEYQRPDRVCGELQIEMQAEDAYHRDRLNRLLTSRDVQAITRENERHQREMQYLQNLYNLYCTR